MYFNRTLRSYLLETFLLDLSFFVNFRCWAIDREHMIRWVRRPPTRTGNSLTEQIKITQIIGSLFHFIFWFVIKVISKKTMIFNAYFKNFLWTNCVCFDDAFARFHFTFLSNSYFFWFCDKGDIKQNNDTCI